MSCTRRPMEIANVSPIVTTATTPGQRACAVAELGSVGPPRRERRHARGRQHHQGRRPWRPDDSGSRDRPACERRGYQPEVETGAVSSGGRHTWTNSRSFSSRAGPIPSTSPSWSTLAKRPFAVRHATIADAVTGPTPGRASSCSTVAALRSTGASGADVGCPTPGAGRCAARRRADGTAHCRRGARRSGEADHELLAVGDAPGHVQPRQIGSVKRSTGSVERVGNPRLRSERHQPGFTHQSHHARPPPEPGRPAPARLPPHPWTKQAEPEEDWLIRLAARRRAQA